MKMFEQVEEYINEFNAECSTVYQSDADCYLSVLKYKIGEDYWISLVDQYGDTESNQVNISDKGLEMLYKALKEIYDK